LKKSNYKQNIVKQAYPYCK